MERKALDRQCWARQADDGQASAVLKCTMPDGYHLYDAKFNATLVKIDRSGFAQWISTLLSTMSTEYWDLIDERHSRIVPLLPVKWDNKQLFDQVQWMDAPPLSTDRYEKHNNSAENRIATLHAKVDHPEQFHNQPYLLVLPHKNKLRSQNLILCTHC